MKAQRYIIQVLTEIIKRSNKKHHLHTSMTVPFTSA